MAWSELGRQTTTSVGEYNIKAENTVGYQVVSYIDLVVRPQLSQRTVRIHDDGKVDS